MTKRKAKTTRKTATKQKSPAQRAVQEAGRVTGRILAYLKNARIAYLRVGELLTQMRMTKLYEALHHKDLESYAAERLHLGRTSLYQYLQVYAWVKEYHPEWLVPHPKGFIPELTDVADLIWIERELARTDLTPGRRAGLGELKRKALAGKLRDGELGKFRRRGHGRGAGLRAFLSALQSLRTRGAKLASMPTEVITYLDAAIEVLQNQEVAEVAGFSAKGGKSLDRPARFAS